ncbi:MAG: tetratricopeptide repeat protein [Bacillota bacterium]
MSEMKGQDEMTQIRFLIQERKLEKASELLKQCIGKEPKNEEAFNLLGVVYEKKGNLEGACLMYRVALTINSTYQPAKNNLHRLVQMPPDLFGIDFGA